MSRFHIAPCISDTDLTQAQKALVLLMQAEIVLEFSEFGPCSLSGTQSLRCGMVELHMEKSTRPLHFESTAYMFNFVGTYNK